VILEKISAFGIGRDTAHGVQDLRSATERQCRRHISSRPVLHEDDLGLGKLLHEGPAAVHSLRKRPTPEIACGGLTSGHGSAHLRIVRNALLMLSGCMALKLCAPDENTEALEAGEVPDREFQEKHDTGRKATDQCLEKAPQKRAVPVRQERHRRRTTLRGTEGGAARSSMAERPSSEWILA